MGDPVVPESSVVQSSEPGQPGMRHGTRYAVPRQVVDEDLDHGQMLGHLDGHVRDQNGRTTRNVAGNAVDREVMRGHEAPRGRGVAHQVGR